MEIFKGDDPKNVQIKNLAKTFLIFSPVLIGLIYAFGPRIMYNDWAVAFYPVSQLL